MIDLDAVMAACAALRRNPAGAAQVHVTVADRISRELCQAIPPEQRAAAGRALLLGLVVAGDVVLRYEPHLCAHTFGDVLALAGQQLLVEAMAATAVAPLDPAGAAPHEQTGVRTDEQTGERSGGPDAT